MPKLQAEISGHETALGDSGLYARDPKRFDQVMKALDAARVRLSDYEMEWLELEEKREALGA